MKELELLARIRRRLRPPKGSGIRLGVGDDCAVFRPRGSKEDLLFTTDLLIEDVHFEAATHPPEAVGHKALARGLSDIAAMGGEPRFSLLSLALPPHVTAEWVDRFYRGLLRLAARSGAPLAGGDLGRAERITCDVVVCGAAPRGRALVRSGARVGDSVCVSGLLGISALGLERKSGPAWARHLRPQPRLALGRFLRERLGATAAMDLSDGLSMDLHRMCLESGVAADLDGPLPVYPGASFDQALHGGEDYELLFTLPKGAEPPARFGRLRLARIGTIRKGPAGAITLSGQPCPPRGYDHFRST